MSCFLFAVVGALSYCLLWYVALSTTITALSGMLGSNCFVNHSIKCLLCKFANQGKNYSLHAVQL